MEEPEHSHQHRSAAGDWLQQHSKSVLADEVLWQAAAAPAVRLV
jgi:hypothetical protein